jgi:hypothetical protein
MNVIAEGAREQPTRRGWLGRLPLIAGPPETGASREAHQFCPHVAASDHDDLSTLRRLCFPETTLWRAQPTPAAYGKFTRPDFPQGPFMGPTLAADDLY